LKKELKGWQKLLKNMAKSESIVDAKGKEIQVADRAHMTPDQTAYMLLHMPVIHEIAKRRGLTNSQS
jgi:hypothetical protein